MRAFHRSNLNRLIFSLLLLLAVTFSAVTPLLAQEPPQSRPQEAADSPTAPPDATPFSPFVQWVRAVLTWWVVLPLLALALAVWFARLSTSPSRDPSRDMR